MKKAGFDIVEGDLDCTSNAYDAKLQTMADELLKKEFMLLGSFFLWYQDKARIRVQLSAAHTKEHLDKARGIY
jgi:glycine C-acetyltransferase